MTRSWVRGRRTSKLPRSMSPQQPSLVSALVVDDHPLFRGAMASLLRTQFPQAKVGEANSAEVALRVGGELDRLGMILLDFRLPGLHGAEAVQLLHGRFPAVPIIVVTASEDRREAAAVIRAGARAFLPKSLSAQDMTQAIERVLNGQELPPRWTSAAPAASIATPTGELTARQLQILALLCQGHSNKEIGLRLGLAVVTVKMHVSAIFRALGVINRTQAVLAARSMGVQAMAEPPRPQGGEADPGASEQ